MVSSFLQPRLLENAIERAWGEIVTRFPGDRDASRLRVVRELTMAAPRPCQIPTVFFKQPDNFLHLHGLDNK